MIYIRSVGGLGNQLFIFSFAHEICDRYLSDVTILTDWHDNVADRPFEIFDLITKCKHNIFMGKSKKITKTLDLFSKVNFKTRRKFEPILNVIGIREQRYPFELYVYSKRLPRFISGYFQNFSNFRNENHAFQEISDYAEEILKNMDPVKKTPHPHQIMHVRRGDYKNIKNSFGLLAEEYYMQLVDSNLPHIILAEDSDISKVFTKLCENSRILDSSNYSSWESISLMSQCDNLVAANSTFSWWGALLASMKGAEVILPKPWTRGNFHDYEGLYFDSAKASTAIFEQ